MISGVPRTNPIADVGRLITAQWDRWFQVILNAVNKASQFVGSVALTAQSGSIAITTIQTPSLTAGLYRVNYAMRVSQPAAVSSSVAFGLGWTCGGVSMTQTSSAMTGNTSSTQQNGVAVILVDASTPIQYATNYASAGAVPMKYQLNIAVEQVP